MSTRMTDGIGLLACLGALAVGGSSTAVVAQPAADAAEDPYPAAAHALNLSGHATLKCMATAEGRVLDCAVASEDPAGWGFGQGALKLAPTINLGPGAPDRPVQVPVGFRRDSNEISDPQLKAPGFFIPSDQVTWVRQPQADDYALTYPEKASQYNRPVRVELGCRVGAEGLLTSCVVLSAHPDSQDIPKAVAHMASRYQMAPRTKIGAPVENGVVKVTLNWASY